MRATLFLLAFIIFGAGISNAYNVGISPGRVVLKIDAPSTIEWNISTNITITNNQDTNATYTIRLSYPDAFTFYDSNGIYDSIEDERIDSQIEDYQSRLNDNISQGDKEFYLKKIDELVSRKQNLSLFEPLPNLTWVYVPHKIHLEPHTSKNITVYINIPHIYNKHYEFLVDFTSEKTSNSSNSILVSMSSRICIVTPEKVPSTPDVSILAICVAMLIVLKIRK